MRCNPVAIAHTQHLARLCQYEREGATAYRDRNQGNPQNREVVEEIKSQDMGRIHKIYETVVGLVIRPPRADYQLQALGPTSFDFLGTPIVREDFHVVNQRGLRVEASMWRNRTVHDNESFLIYLHGNASCRLEAIQVLSVCLNLGIGVVAIDCAGSGKSEGHYVSLGYYEALDALAVSEHLRVKYMSRAVKIGLMGRSMGAVSSLLYASQYDPRLACVVADSPFSSLTDLFYDMVKRQAGGVAAKIVVDVTTQRIAATVQHRAKFNVDENNPVGKVIAARAPAMIIHGQQDTLIPAKHSSKIQKKYLGQCSLFVPEGEHNDERPRDIYIALQDFLAQHLSPAGRPSHDLAAVPLPADGKMGDPRNVMLYPPWCFSLRGGQIVAKSPPKAMAGRRGDREYRSGMSAERQGQAEAAVRQLSGRR